jgi:hypothetical protein
MGSVSGAEPNRSVSIRILDLHATTESDRLLRRPRVPPVQPADKCFPADALCGTFVVSVSERKDWGPPRKSAGMAG